MNIQAIEEDERDEIVYKLREFYELDEPRDLIPHLYEANIMEGDVEVRFFPIGENPSDEGPVKGVYFEVTVEDGADWNEDLAMYRKANLSNGSRMYTALDKELKDIAEEAIDVRPEFVAAMGSGTFSAKVLY